MGTEQDLAAVLRYTTEKLEKTENQLDDALRSCFTATQQLQERGQECVKRGEIIAGHCKEITHLREANAKLAAAGDDSVLVRRLRDKINVLEQDNSILKEQATVRGQVTKALHDETARLKAKISSLGNLHDSQREMAQKQCDQLDARGRANDALNQRVMDLSTALVDRDAKIATLGERHNNQRATIQKMMKQLEGTMPTVAMAPNANLHGEIERLKRLLKTRDDEFKAYTYENPPRTVMDMLASWDDEDPVPVAEAKSLGRYRHKKTGGFYDLLTDPQADGIRMQAYWPVGDMQPLVLYRSCKDGSLWVRPPHEFIERFTSVVDTKA